MSAGPQLRFLGGAGTVTGSRFLVTTSRAKVLVDAGLFQGLKEHRLRNWEPFPVDASTIDAIVMTHAHIDHCGYIPVLVRDGFTGPIHTTTASASLAAIVLPDSGHLQEEEAKYANRKGYSKHKPARPLYTEEDALVALEQLSPVAFGKEVEVAPGVHVVLEPAGHILGSAIVHLRLEDAADRRITFSGDLGRPHHPILRPPAPIGRTDVVVMESTYGNRHHDDVAALEVLAEAINRTARRAGTVVIPAFAVDRTEVVLFHLRELVESGAIPNLPVFVDSPMALAALGVYRRAIRDGGREIDRGLTSMPDPFDTGNITEIHEVAASKALADVRMPCIIVSASGMATGGRVVHHLARLLPDHRNTILLVGFQAPGTRGRLLADKVRTLRMLGREVPVRAEIVEIGSFSVHADQSELSDWVATAAPPPEIVYLVHGEPAAAEELRGLLSRRLTSKVSVAELGASVPLT